MFLSLFNFNFFDSRGAAAHTLRHNSIYADVIASVRFRFSFFFLINFYRTLIVAATVEPGASVSHRFDVICAQQLPLIFVNY